MEQNTDKTQLPKHIVSNSTLDKCIELFDKLTPMERLIVMDKTCKNCGNTIEEWVCSKCDNPC